jgi:ATP-dependent protease ClpP protease subunit
MLARGVSFLIFGWICLACSTSEAAYIRSSISSEGKVVLFLDGKIETGDATTFKNLIRGANAANRLVSGIRLNSPGGSLAEGVALADIIRYGKIATVVPAGAQCASACFLVFAAGPEKYASYTANVGVHGASNQSGVEEGDATVSMGRAAKELGVPDNIIGKMVITPPDQIVWLGPNDLRSMGTVLTGKPSQVPLAEQTSPQTPLDLDPSNQASAADTAPLTWQKLVQGAFALSQQQNGGKANVQRVCQPEVKLCHTAIFFSGKDGNDVMLKSSEDAMGRVLSHEVCTFNEFGDTRVCADWDTHAMHRDMKDKNGDWFAVGDE